MNHSQHGHRSLSLIKQLKATKVGRLCCVLLFSLPVLSSAFLTLLKQISLKDHSSVMWKLRRLSLVTLLWKNPEQFLLQWLYRTQALTAGDRSQDTVAEPQYQGSASEKNGQCQLVLHALT